jgi:DNA-directed RNA polymerase specialized sigma24 family protein
MAGEQRTPEQAAFEAAWFEPRTHKVIAGLSRKFAHPPVGADDLYQRTFLKLWSSPSPPTGKAVVYAANDTMRHFRTTHFRRQEQKTSNRDADVDEVVPASKPGDAERRTAMSESVTRVRGILEKKLGGTPAGDRALAVIDAKLADDDDTGDLMKRLGATRTQIYEATRLAMNTLKDILAHEP